MTQMIKEGALSTRPPLLDGSNYAFWKACLRIYLKANDERKLSRFPNKAHRHHKLEFCTWKFKKFLKCKRTGGGFKSANAKKDFMPRKFDNDNGKGKGAQCYECQSFGHIASECAIV
ncbi:hypothetical protein ACOSQ4_029128 [Xanthoceras sorbifolium]